MRRKMRRGLGGGGGVPRVAGIARLPSRPPPACGARFPHARLTGNKAPPRPACGASTRSPRLTAGRRSGGGDIDAGVPASGGAARPLLLGPASPPRSMAVCVRVCLRACERVSACISLPPECYAVRAIACLAPCDARISEEVGLASPSFQCLTPFSPRHPRRHPRRPGITRPLRHDLGRPFIHIAHLRIAPLRAREEGRLR